MCQLVLNGVILDSWFQTQTVITCTCSIPLTEWLEPTGTRPEFQRLCSLPNLQLVLMNLLGHNETILQ